MKSSLLNLLLPVLLLSSTPMWAADQGKAVTTQQAADAAKRQGRSGTTNENAEKQLKEIESQDIVFR